VVSGCPEGGPRSECFLSTLARADPTGGTDVNLEIYTLCEACVGTGLSHPFVGAGLRLVSLGCGERGTLASAFYVLVAYCPGWCMVVFGWWLRWAVGCVRCACTCLPSCQRCDHQPDARSTASQGQAPQKQSLSQEPERPPKRKVPTSPETTQQPDKRARQMRKREARKWPCTTIPKHRARGPSPRRGGIDRA
jgi:hypothetical protein